MITIKVREQLGIILRDQFCCVTAILVVITQQFLTFYEKSITIWLCVDNSSYAIGQKGAKGIWSITKSIIIFFILSPFLKSNTPKYLTNKTMYHNITFIIITNVIITGALWNQILLDAKRN